MRTRREQFRNAVLEYLSPEAYSNRLSHSANMVTRDQANRTGSTPEKGYLQAGRQIDDLYKTRSDRVSKVQRGRRGGGNSRLNRKGFDDKRAVGENKPRPATLNLGKTLDIADIEESNSQVGQRAQFDRKARLMRNRFGADADANAGSNVADQARARHNQKMAVNRFGKGAFAAAGNTASAQAASDRQMKQTNKRFQRREQQFKKAVLNYLDETSLGLKTAVSTARSMRNRSIPDVQLITTKADYDPEKVKDQDKRDNQEIKNNARMEKAAVAELKPRSDEGKSTGGDVGATMDRLGKWYKGINPNAKPGEEGYMRKRNVPPAEGEYDPTKHKAPVEGEPLKYMKPQHKDYAIASINNQVGKVAARSAEKEDKDLGPAGNIHKRHKAKIARQKDLNKIGRSILDKYKVPNPSVPEMAAKWTAGNMPKTKENPEGYVRSDEERSKDDSNLAKERKRINDLDEKESTVFYGSQYGDKNDEVEVHRDRNDGTTRRKKFSGKRAEGLRKALAARLPNLNPDSKKRKNPGRASHDDETMGQTDRRVATVGNRTEDAALRKRFPKKPK